MHGRNPNSPESAQTPLRDRREVRPAQNSRLMLLLVVAAVVITVAVFFAGGEPNSGDNEVLAETATSTQVSTPASVPSIDAAAVQAAALAAQPPEEPAVEERTVDLDGCQLTVIEITVGDTGESVECTQKALYAAGFYDGEFTGTFDEATATAVKGIQAQRGLYVDGIVGPQTAESLGIWPGDESFVVRTPAPAPGTMDRLGYELSPVASKGSDAPPVPGDTGEGRRIVYSRAEQRVWAIDDDEYVIRSYLVTGSQYANEVPGRHEVYSRSETTTAWNGAADLPLMVRWLDTERGAIGFHGIPNHRDTGEPYQTTAELGTKLSGGCQRQHLMDARFMWEFGQIGTPVYVV
ncbi:MAG TPA: L,D-transpeptidase family protein [Ilumatobacter sp.]|nr:L,D-transpeptidase family protein [Ilumatobacter sp.]